MEPLVRQIVQERLAQIRTAPGNPDAWSGLGRAYHANDLIDLAGPCYEEALSIEQNDAISWYLLARVRAELGDVDGALAAVDQAIVHDPTAAFVHWRRGFWLAQQGKLDAAETAFQNAMKLQRADPIATVGLACVAAERQDYASAAALLEPIAGSFPGNSGIYVRNLLGQSYQRSGRRTEAQGLIAQTPVTDVSWPDPWSNQLYQDRRLSEWIVIQAHQMIQAGNPAAALAALQPLAQTYGNDITVLKMIGQASFALGQIDAAMNALRQVVEQQPDDFSANMNLAYAHEQRGQFSPALGYAAKAAKLRPALVPAQLQYARILIATGDATGAIAVLEPVIWANPDLPLGYRHLAVAYADAGQHERAGAAMARYVDLAPNDPELHVLQQDLEAARNRSESNP